MQTMLAEKPSSRTGLETYVIRGGEEGAARLGVLARALAPSTAMLFDRLGPVEGFTVIDAACGGGDVSVELARRVGSSGRVIGFDLDEEKLRHAEERARAAGFRNCMFVHTDVTKPWTVRGADIVYARFILTHLREPWKLLEQARDALGPGGLMVAEDIDAEGRFCDPPCEAFVALNDYYLQVTRKKGCDPIIGRRLDTLLAERGFTDIRSALAQPHGREGAVKEVMALTYRAIAETVIAAGLASRPQFDRLVGEFDAFASRHGTLVSMPRVFQAWGVKPPHRRA